MNIMEATRTMQAFAPAVQEMAVGRRAAVQHIDRRTYEELAAKLTECACGHLYISNECISTDDEAHELVISADVYYERYSAPDLDDDRIVDFKPIYCRLFSFDADGNEVANDFDFEKLKQYI